MTEIQLERIKLRQITQEDWDFLLMLESRPESNEFQNIREPDEDYLRLRFEYFFDCAEHFPEGGGIRFIVEKEGEPIGDVSLVCTYSDTREWELGFSFLREHWGNGYAAEAVEGIKEYAFRTLNAHRLVMNILYDNKKAIALAERAGFKKEAHFRKSSLIDEKWHDETVYALLS